VHWTSHFPVYPAEAGFWSVTGAEDIETVGGDWRTYSSELAASPPPRTFSRSR